MISRYNCPTCGKSTRYNGSVKRRCSTCIRASIRKCEICSTLFVSRLKRICSKKCAANKFGRGPERRFYVYTWNYPGNDIPIYVGKGSGNRAYRPSKPEDCEARIVRDHLSEAEAFQVEAALISVYLSLGAELLNKIRDL